MYVCMYVGTHIPIQGVCVCVWTLHFVQEVIDILRSPGHGITLLMAHDNMLTAFLIALGVYKEQWPLYASQVVLLGSNCIGRGSWETSSQRLLQLRWHGIDPRQCRTTLN